MIQIGKALNSGAVLLSTGLLLFGLNIGQNPSVSTHKSTLKLAIENRMGLMGLKHSNRIYQSQASWYGGYFHGRQTANQETFDKNILSAAHKSLPLNTYLLVTNLENGRKTIVRVNDRGPYIPGRELDLSEAAAKLIGSYSRGVVSVRYEILESA
jgi:rare lipoprotein A